MDRKKCNIDMFTTNLNKTHTGLKALLVQLVQPLSIFHLAIENKVKITLME